MQSTVQSRHCRDVVGITTRSLASRCGDPLSVEGAANGTERRRGAALQQPPTVDQTVWRRRPARATTLSATGAACSAWAASSAARVTSSSPATAFALAAVVSPARHQALALVVADRVDLAVGATSQFADPQTLGHLVSQRLRLTLGQLQSGHCTHVSRAPTLDRRCPSRWPGRAHRTSDTNEFPDHCKKRRLPAFQQMKATNGTREAPQMTTLQDHRRHRRDRRGRHRGRLRRPAPRGSRPPRRRRLTPPRPRRPT